MTVQNSMPVKFSLTCVATIICFLITPLQFGCGQSTDDTIAKTNERIDQIREMQQQAFNEKNASWGHWGYQPHQYNQWNNHSNRLIPVYTFGITLNQWREEGSKYRDAEKLKALYGTLPNGTLNPLANYYDQTDIYHLQQTAVEQGYRHIVLIVFDGMDWQTTHAAASYKQGHVPYMSGRGRGLSFLDDTRIKTDFALVCTSPKFGKTDIDVNAQTVTMGTEPSTGGFDPMRGGSSPWGEPVTGYLIGRDREQPHTFTDSASSASSLTAGIKTYNGSINYGASGEQVVPIARQLETMGYKTGIVSSVPISHATPAAAYANNVTRSDYQDISRDLLGLPSISHKTKPLRGLDVVIGGGWSPDKESDGGQGANFLKGNRYLHQTDLDAANTDNQGQYVVATRTQDVSGAEILEQATTRAIREHKRLLGFFGTKYDGHLPFQTADGNFNPAADGKGQEEYTKEDITENPTLTQMTEAALEHLSANDDKFWLMIEAGDVDWANHANNIDNSIGAVLSGEAAFNAVMNWVDKHQAWDQTAVIVTADHGHFFVNRQPQAIANANND